MLRNPLHLAFVLACSLGLAAAAVADEGHTHAAGETHSHEAQAGETGEAHSHEGENGGVVVDAGQFHMELVADGTKTVTVYLSDTGGEPVSTEGFKANAIFVIDGKSQRFALEPVDGSRLVGTAPAPVEEGAKGVVQFTEPDGETAQAKF